MADISMPPLDPNSISVANCRISMSTAEWQTGFPTGNVVTTYRGIRIVINLGETGNPIEIGWFIGGREVQSIRVNCHLELAKKLGVEVVDDRMSVDEEWKEAERKDSGFDLVE